MNQLYHQGRLNLRIRPDLDFGRQNPLAAQFRTQYVISCK